MADRPVRSLSGGIQVITTERGLPTALKIDAREFDRPPQELADEIHLLCKLSAMRAQVARRRDLTSRGFGQAVIRRLNLATEEELATVEAELRGDDEDPPETWMMPV
jgi:hypothetical protein